VANVIEVVGRVRSSAMYQKFRHRIERFLLSPAYFLLFSIYPVFELYARNAHGIPPSDVFRPLLVSILLTLLLFWVVRLVTRHHDRSAMIVFTILFAFYYYGHVRSLLYASGIFIEPVSLSIAWLGMAMLIITWIVRRAHAWYMPAIVPILNLIVVVLLLFPLLRLARYLVAVTGSVERNSMKAVQLQRNFSNPDIYYIVLDAYTRSDVMREKYGYDNSSFIDSLKNMGFYVAECGQANYGSTSFSLASTLNMDYLQNIIKLPEPNEIDLLPVFELLESNVVRNALTNAGYKTAVFASGFYWVEWRDADYFISPPTHGLTEFEIVIIFSTYARVLDDFQVVNLDDIHADRYRERTRLVLESFDVLMDIPSPKFVFIHLSAPHERHGID